MDKKYQVFISSTYIDLVEARQKVIETILALHQIPAGMEMFPAADDDQWTHIKAEIDRSDYYVLILGHRYGSVDPVDGISYTEKEYDYARTQGIPVLAFIASDEVLVKPSVLDDSQTARKKLDKFKSKASSDKLRKSWNSIDDLAAKVSAGLSHAFVTKPRVGWVRGNQAVSPQIAEEIATLSRENRQLKEELEGLRKVNDKKPLLELVLNRGENIDLKFERIDIDGCMSVPSKLDAEIPGHLTQYLTKEKIEEYNHAVPKDIEKVNEYNHELRLHKIVNFMGSDVELHLQNTGSLKANDIHVDIEFPESVLVLEGDKEDYSLPERPSLTINPLKKAESQYQKAKLGLNTSLLESLSNYSNLSSLYAVPTLRNFPMVGGTNGFDPNFYTDLEGNTISLYCKDLIHTRSRTSGDKYILVPLKIGEYEIKISVMCEEYAEPEVFKVPIVITEN